MKTKKKVRYMAKKKINAVTYINKPYEKKKMKEEGEKRSYNIRNSSYLIHRVQQIYISISFFITSYSHYIKQPETVR